MTSGLNVDPDSLRQLADKHAQIANEIRDWAEPPSQWLADFPRTYGTISNPVYKALQHYYNARQQAGNNLAASHDHTAAALNAAAASYEQADENNAASLNTAANNPGAAGSPTNSTGLAAAPTGGGVAVGGGAPATPTGGSPAAAAVSPGGAASAGAAQARPAGPMGPVAPDGVGTPPPAQPVDDEEPGGMPSLFKSGGSDAAAGRTADESGGPDASGESAGTAPGMVSAPVVAPPPVPVSLGAIAAAAADEDAEPSYVVGAVPDEDLALARAVLGGVLAATQRTGGSSVVGVGWGVGVFRGVSGVGVFVCSNEGRGWLPAGLFLPVGVSVPWVWGVVGGVGLGWEGCGDAVRVLVEFARVWGPVAGSRLSAVVSSGPVDVGLAGLLGAGVSVEGFVGASGSGGLQLGVGGPGLVDRLGLVGAGVVGAGSVGAGGVDGVGWVEGVAEGELVSGCVGLGWDVHVRVGGLGVLEAVAVRGVRERVLVGLRSGTPVSDVLWDELRDEDVLLGVLVGSLRVDVSDVGLGELRFDDVGSRRLRGLVFERRCSEVVLLMRGGCSRQVLRDVVYAVGQVLDHPLFDTDLAAAAVVSGAAAAASAGAVPSVGVSVTDTPAARRDDPVHNDENGKGI